MSWSNYHGHCHYCDGYENPADYIPEAIKQKLKVIGFSCHAPVPFITDWTMPDDKLLSYLLEIDELKLEAPEGLTILKSLEVDYIPDIAGPLHPDILASGLDYVVGSIHFVDKLPSGEHWSIDNSNEEFELGVNEIFRGDIQKAITRYFELVREMCRLQPPTILGHMDKIRMHNVSKPHFDENADWYVILVRDTLKTASRKNIIVEINTKYFKKNGLMFPSQQHFSWMYKNGVKVTINSDAHRPKSLSNGFEEVATLLKEAGYNDLWEWNGHKFAPMPFDETGIYWSEP